MLLYFQLATSLPIIDVRLKKQIFHDDLSSQRKYLFVHIFMKNMSSRISIPTGYYLFGYNTCPGYWLLPTDDDTAIRIRSSCVHRRATMCWVDRKDLVVHVKRLMDVLNGDSSVCDDSFWGVAWHHHLNLSFWKRRCFVCT